jgi:hypothetical protein
MIKTLLLAFNITLPLGIAAQVIPPSMRVDWSRAGNEIAIPSSTVSVADFGAVGDATTDNSAAFMAAINSFNGMAGVVEVPAGTYLLSSPLNLPDSIVLRGYSTDSTHLYFNLNGAGVNCINMEKAQAAAFTQVLSGYTKGSDSLILAANPGLAAGDLIELRQQNGSWDIAPASWAAFSVGQLVRIASVQGNMLRLDQPLRIDYDPSLIPEVRKIVPRVNTGIECLHIERMDAAASGYNISFSYADNCYIKGVHSSKSAGAHVSAASSSHIEISGSYFHHAFAYDGTSTRGYGVMLHTHASDCLIENNIFNHLRHSMMVKQGANGNVFAYNYSIDPFRTEVPNNAGGDISLHGHYAYANLFEGNIVQNIHIDKTWGPSGPYNTFFRNRAELYGIIMTQDSINSDMQNFVGNELTNTTYGFYLLAGTGHFEHGNNVQGIITPAGTGTLADNSYYLTTAPPFWSSSSWPSIGVPSTLGSGSIPAQIAYSAGVYTSCSTQPSGIDEEEKNLIRIYPNPSAGAFFIEGIQPGHSRIVLKDLAGRTVWRHENESRSIIIPAHLARGVYLLSIELEKATYHAKLIKQ